MNYEKLKSTVADWLHRTDLNKVIPAFIKLAESRINRDIRVAEMETEIVGDVDGNDIELPDNYRQIKFLMIDGTPVNYVSNLQGHAYTNNILGYTQINNKIRPFAKEGSKYQLVYYAQVPSLSEDEPENWLLSKYPDIYLYATLIESAPYIKDDGRVATWATAYQNAITTLMQQNEIQRFGDTGLTIRRA